MAKEFTLKALAFVLFLALLGGSTYAASRFIHPEPLAPRGLVVDALSEEIAIAPGHEAAVGFVVKSSSSAEEAVVLRVLETGGLATNATSARVNLTVPASGSAAELVPVAVPQGAAPGSYALRVEAATVAEPVKRSVTTVTVRVLGDAGPKLAEGQSADVYYVGRLVNGSHFNANMPDYADAPFPRLSFYAESPGNLSVRTGAGSNVFPGFWKGIIGMQVGETRTIRVSPEEGAGNRTTTETEDRTTTIERRFELAVQEIPRPFEAFAEHIRATGQGTPEEYKVNDTFLLTQGPNTWTFKITAIDGTNVRYVPVPPVGTKFTLPSSAAWPNSSEVQSVNDTKIVFYTTPATARGVAFTYYDFWPNASAVTTLTDEEIVVTHTPAVGLQYTIDEGQQGPVTYTVESVGDETITVSRPSPRALAGETLVFDVRLLRIA